MRAGWLLLLGLVACGEAADVPESGDQSVATDSVLDRPAEPASLAELAPGDTLGLLDLMRRIINQTNTAAASALRRDSTMASEGYREARRLTLWSVDDTPIKLIATEPNDAGLMTGETIVWFVNGEVRAVQEPFDVLYFEVDRLSLWTDEAMVPVEIPENDRMAKEKMVIDSVKARLAKFGVAYPR
jgi:hypothetical protein